MIQTSFFWNNEVGLMCGLTGEKVPLYGVFHLLIYVGTYLIDISPLIYIQRDKPV
jgi:hypothetical protein